VAAFMRDLLCFLGLVTVSLLPSQAAASDLDPTLAVGIFSGQRLLACAITSQGPLTLQDPRGTTAAKLPPGAAVRFEAAEDQVAFSCAQSGAAGRGERYLLVSSDPLQVTPDGAKSRAYRGRLQLSARQGRLVLINLVALEDYLRGVLPSEIPSRFEPAALQAQAIAARTYALVTAGRHRADGCDLCDALHCQVYLGMAEENPRTDAAISATTGLVVTYEGKPIHAVYHDCCGGRTAANETAWSGSQPLPYLRPVRDGEETSSLCSHSPRAVWTRQLPQARLAAALAAYRVSAPISSFEPADCDDNGRPRAFRIRGGGGEVTILAGVLRAALNQALGPDTLPSADFTAAPNGDSIVFAGRGSGHGVGLCQWGANAMAQQGKSASDILTHYYTGAAVEPLSAEIVRRLGRQATG